MFGSNFEIIQLMKEETSASATSVPKSCTSEHILGEVWRTVKLQHYVFECKLRGDENTNKKTKKVTS